jgi:hypothetical protein
MESKQVYKVKVGNRIFSVYCHSKYHAIDKVYTAFNSVESNRNKYKVIK